MADSNDIFEFGADNFDINGMNFSMFLDLEVEADLEVDAEGEVVETAEGDAAGAQVDAGALQDVNGDDDAQMDADANAAQQDFDAMLETPQQDLQTTPDPDFWSQAQMMTLANGMPVSGTNQQLWDKFPELRPALAQAVAPNGAPPTTPSKQPSGFPYHPPTQGYGTPVSGYQPNQTPSTAAAGPSLSPSPAPGKKRKRATIAPPTTTLPPYQPSMDLSSAAAAREYMSRFDPSEAVALDIPDDDVDAVKSNIHTYAAAIYTALLHPYTPVETLTVELNTPERRKAYTEQQDAALFALQKSLATPIQLKTAKACALMLVDAAIALHTTGVSAERHAKHSNMASKNLKPDDAYKIELELRCSQRVRAMVAAVEGNKLVAKDVLARSNFLRFAESPAAYVGRKFAYLRSNKTRQDKVDARLAVEEEERVQAVKEARAAKRLRYPS